MLNEQVGARAFTVGNDIFLGAGTSASDEHVMAHELGHVVQQRQMSDGAVPAVLPAGDAREQEADNFAREALSSSAAQPVAETPRAQTSTPSMGRIQRWVGTEHQELGDSGAVGDVDLGNGVVLTFGQVVAIAGDEYPDLDSLRHDTQDDAGKARIRAALQHAGVMDARTAALPAPSDDQVKQHERDYIGLLLRNAAHFAASGAIDQWQGQHTSAVSQALVAGLANKPTDLAQAQATEAFAQHFLTDAFSGGHVRTPRQEIMDWYTATFAPAVADRFVNVLKERFVAQFTIEVYMQLGGVAPIQAIHSKIEETADEQLADALTKIGGHQVLVEYFGLAMAGAVSGALHDMEGERGVWVSSTAHPEAFQAFGDNLLDDPRNATNKAQAQLAVAAAQQDVNAAYSIGEQHAADASTTPDSLPSTVYFGFDSSTLSANDTTTLGTAGAYMADHPDTHVALVGNTDPLGSSDYNMNLGMRRAESVAAALMARGAPPTQIDTSSAGEEQLVATDPKQYNLDRRTELRWSSQANQNPDPNGPGARAQQEVEAQVGPPYQKVLDLIPHPTDSGAAPNPELEDWHWGSMPPNLVARIDQWAKEHLTGSVGTVINQVPEDISKDLTVVTVHVHPRAAMQLVVDDLLAAPTEFLGRMFGRSAGGGQ